MTESRSVVSGTRGERLIGMEHKRTFGGMEMFHMLVVEMVICAFINKFVQIH